MNCIHCISAESLAVCTSADLTRPAGRYVSLEQKRLDQNKPFDAKVAAWIPDKEEGFVQGKIVGTKGDLVTVAIPGGDVSCGRGTRERNGRICR